jgi:Zn finger protein HypA/HybF involved in hydrogenase expression
MSYRPGKIQCRICRRWISKPLLKDHHNQEHRQPERCPKCGQRGDGITMRHWNRCM